MTTPPETAADFLTERQDFLYVYATRSVGGGWDVALRVDGSYVDLEDAEAAAAGIRQRLDSLTGVGKTKRVWWFGPPWGRR
jgi:hypothetical protein